MAICAATTRERGAPTVAQCTVHYSGDPLSSVADCRSSLALSHSHSFSHSHSATGRTYVGQRPLMRLLLGKPPNIGGCECFNACTFVICHAGTSACASFFFAGRCTQGGRGTKHIMIWSKCAVKNTNHAIHTEFRKKNESPRGIPRSRPIVPTRHTPGAPQVRRRA